MQKSTEKNFFVLEIMAFEYGVVTYLYYQVNSCDRHSTCYQTVLRSQMWLEEMFSNWIFSRLMWSYDKSATLQSLSVFGLREHVDSRKVFWNGSFLAYK